MNGYEVEFELRNAVCSRKSANPSTFLLFFYGFLFRWSIEGSQY